MAVRPAPGARRGRCRLGGWPAPAREFVYGRAWQGARLLAFTPAVANSPLARRPYDLRHACLSTWLNGGVEPTQVAEWAGNSVQVLLRVYQSASPAATRSTAAASKRPPARTLPEPRKRKIASSEAAVLVEACSTDVQRRVGHTVGGSHLAGSSARSVVSLRDTASSWPTSTRSFAARRMPAGNRSSSSATCSTL